MPVAVDVVAAYTQTDMIVKIQTAAVGQIRTGDGVQTQPAANTWVEVDTYPARVRGRVPARAPAHVRCYPFLRPVVYVPDGNTSDDTSGSLLYS